MPRPMRPFIRKSRHARHAEITRHVADGLTSPQQIARAMRCTPELVRYYVRQMPHITTTVHRPHRERFRFAYAMRAA